MLSTSSSIYFSVEENRNCERMCDKVEGCRIRYCSGWVGEDLIYLVTFNFLEKMLCLVCNTFDNCILLLSLIEINRRH